MKVVNPFGSEIRNLLAFRAVDGLQPEVVDAVAASRIDDGFPVVSKAQESKQRALEFHQLRLSGIGGNQRYLLLVLAGVFERGKCGELAVGRNVDAAVGNRQIRYYLRRSAVDRDACQLPLVPLLDVVHPAAIGRADGKLIALAGGELFQVSARGVDAPDVVVTGPSMKQQFEI